MSTITIGDLTFERWISYSTIARLVNTLAIKLQEKELKDPLFIGILQGSYVFMADLVRAYGQSCSSDWLRVSTYDGTETTGILKWGYKPNSTNWADKDIILVEDIIDTGYTIQQIYRWAQEQQPRSLHVVSLLAKPDAIQHPIPDALIGLSIPDHFIVGYGLDYQEYGRNLRDIYRIIPAEQSA